MADNIYTEEYDEQQKQQINDVLSNQKASYSATPYPSYEERLNKLTLLKKTILAHEEALTEALSTDFGCRSKDDSKIADILPTILGINYAVKKLKKWMKPSKRHVGPLFQPAKAFVMYQPVGVVGIVTPWNYPIFLALGPLTTALAAGNKAMIKLSEFTPETNKVMIKMLKDVFPSSDVATFDGGPMVAAHFTAQAFDHLIFTGSTRVGKLVMAAAAQNLTPVTLELGGKSPTIIADDIDIDDAVSRFILGKTLNAGQTCVAPDYILCPQNKVEQLIESCRKQFEKMYPNFETNQDFGSIINTAQFERLQQRLADAKAKGAQIHPLAQYDENASQTRKLPIILLTQLTEDMDIMQEEIFGPLLPIVSYNTIDEAITYINERPRPLALYLCSHNPSLHDKVIKKTHAGGVCINDAAIQVAQDDMPFGGIGPSGLGHYHGHEGFLTFSKAKSVIVKGKLNTSAFAFPPYGKLIHKLIYKFFLK